MGVGVEGEEMLDKIDIVWGSSYVLEDKLFLLTPVRTFSDRTGSMFLVS